jgi:hypothetical protein
MVFAQGSQRIPTGIVSPNIGVPIYPSFVRWYTAQVNCTVFIAGVRTWCTVEVRNSTDIMISPSTVGISLLTDGGGLEQCPYPQLQAISTTVLGFGFTPQHPGLDGTLKLTFLCMPLLIAVTNETLAYYSFNTSGGYNTTRVVPWYDEDLSIMKFTVQQPFAQLQQYAYSNLLNISGFMANDSWIAQFGVYRFPGYENGTQNGDMEGITLRNTTAVASLSQTVTVPANSVSCRFTIHYYFTAQYSTGINTWERIGEVQLSMQGIPFKVFTLYSHLRQVVVVTNNAGRGSLDGDLYTFEQLAADVSILPGEYEFTVSLLVDNRYNYQLWFLDPALHCAYSAETARTNLGDIRALERIYNSVGQNSTLSNWKIGSVFNGDPCINEWQGVKCNLNRVVGLHLENVGLSGVFPPIREMTYLEELRLAHNSLNGSFAVNNSALRIVDIEDNQIVQMSLSNGNFTYEGSQCLTLLNARQNRLSSFPNGITSLQRLELLDLSLNGMFGTVPNDFSTMTSLKGLFIDSNRLSGELPIGLPVYSLISADFAANQFTGTIPTQWSLLQNVLFIDVSTNFLNGTIPWSIGQIRTGDALVFRAANNFLTGITPYLQIRLLDVRSNFFSCPVMGPEIQTNTSAMNEIACWGLLQQCNSTAAPLGS